MSTNQLSVHSKQSIKNFEQKLLNRSVCDLLILEKLADYLLQCCSAEAKANTLSMCSVIPLLVVTFLVPTEPSIIHYILAFVALVLQQILDIANKKQAHRLSSFSFGTFYFDHTCDSYSVICIVYIMGRLLMIPNNWIWLCLFVFGVLPFYIAHLGMYYGEYMRFAVVSPVSEGMIVLEIICIVGAIFGNSLFLKVLFGVQVNLIIAVIAGIWLVFYLISNIKQIVKGNGTHNLFVIFVLGYIIFEMSVIETQQIINEDSNLIFGLFIFSLALCHSLLTGELLLKYGANEKFMQISMNTLFFTAFLVIVYAIFAFIDFKTEEVKEGEKTSEQILATIATVILAVSQLIGYVYRSTQIKNSINQAINE